MQKPELVTLTVGPATLSVPADVVVQNLLDSLVRNAAPAAQPMVLAEGFMIPRIGEFWPGQGGVYAGLMRGENGQPDYHLIVPTNPAAYAKALAWGGRGTDEPGAQSEYDGLANTLALVDSDADHPAAEWADSLVIDGHGDFYLPARRELALCYANVPELFEKAWHWSSTQYSPDRAWHQIFVDGTQNSNDKDTEGRVRVVRRFISHSVI